MAKKTSKQPPRQPIKRTSSQALEFGGTFEMDWRGGELAELAWGVAQEILRDAVDDVVRKAKENVKPGRGPKPHTTSGERVGIHFGSLFNYGDTGKLRDSVTSSISRKSGFLIASVWSDTAKTGGIPYGMYLELGFHPADPFRAGKRYGSFYRYPWLGPAFLEVAEEYKDMMPARFRHHLQDKEAKGRNKTYVKILRKITDTSNIMIQFKRGTRRMRDRLERLETYGYNQVGTDEHGTAVFDVDPELMRQSGKNRNK